MWGLAGVIRLLLPRWPIVLVAPTFTYAGYSDRQVIGLGLQAIALTERAFVKVLPLDRD